MFNAPNVIIEAKSILISKVDIQDQQLAMELLNNILDVAYSCGKVDGVNTAKDLLNDYEMGVAR